MTEEIADLHGEVPCTNYYVLDERVAPFGIDYEIAQACGRMETGTHRPHDIAAPRHGCFESRVEGIFGTNYRTSHRAAESRGYAWHLN